MDLYNSDNSNLSKQKDDNNLMDNNSFFSSDSIKPLLLRLTTHDYEDNISRNNLILDVIRQQQPISKYHLAKITGISYTTIKQITKEFCFVGLVKLKISMGDNGMPVKLIYIEEETAPINQEEE